MVITRSKSTRSTALRWLWSVAALGILSSTLSCAEEDDNSNTVAIGLLLPFSGAYSATSANFERAAIYAVDRVNAAGGIRGKRVRLVAADTHSGLSRSIESAQHLIDEGVVVVLGMESSDIAETVEPMFSEHGVALMSPLVGTASDTFARCEDLWFRLAPSARTLGNALAKELFSEHVPSVVILGETDEYNQHFVDATVERFELLGGSVPLRLDLDPTAQSYGTVLDQVSRIGVPNIVLAASPRTASLVVNESYVTKSAPLNWYLSPLLKTHLFIQDVAPEALNGAKGVAPKIYDTSNTFPQAFERRWTGDLPLEGAYFYYDAVAIVAYALQATSPPDGGAISLDAFKQSVIRLTTRAEVSTDAAIADPTLRMGSATVTWNEIERGLQDVEAGKYLFYAGVTGPILFDTCGARRIGTFSTWTVQAGQIVDG